MRTMGKAYDKEHATIHIDRKLKEDFMRMVVNKYGSVRGKWQDEVEAALRAWLNIELHLKPLNGGD